MAEQILIPTNFSVESLNMVREVVENNNELNADIILACGVHPPDSITELLFFSKRKLKDNYISEEFMNALRFLQNRYPQQINSINIELIVYNTKSFVKNFLDANHIETVYLPSNGKLFLPNKECFDICDKLLKSFNGQLNYLKWTSEKIKKESNNTIADIFFRKINPRSIPET